MGLIRVVVAMLGVAAAVWALLIVPLDDPIGPAVAGPSELEQPSTGSWADEDWEIFRVAVVRAAEQGLDTVPFGDAVAAVGRSFVGTAYVPGTLEVPGPERVVVNFRGLDCVTFVENAIAIARFVRGGGLAVLGNRSAAEERYRALLEEMRYRDGVLDGYPSRLHYFSEWIADNARRGLLVDLGPELGAVPDPEPVDFMSTHPDAYRQLADPDVLADIRAVEERLSAGPRRYVPEGRIAAVADRIRDGDVIAATSTVAGLDVAHTGLALHVDGRLHLLHAPLVGDSVEVSELPLADRILRIEAQDGIMVARPQEGGAGN